MIRRLGTTEWQSRIGLNGRCEPSGMEGATHASEVPGQPLARQGPNVSGSLDRIDLSLELCVVTLICDKCSAEILPNARFCPNCADPVTDADRPALPNDPHRERVQLVCPKCEAQDIHEVDFANRSSVTCEKCRTRFETRLLIVRAKRSASSKRQNLRNFSVRVQSFDGKDDLIEFVNAGTDDFELRSRDIAAFSYLNDKITIVQNLKINRYMKVSKPSCFLATCVYGVDSPEVQVLRVWRDNRLLISALGTKLVDLYYKVSPCLVRMLEKSEGTQRVVRFFLAWLVSLASYDISRILTSKVESQMRKPFDMRDTVTELPPEPNDEHDAPNTHSPASLPHQRLDRAENTRNHLTGSPVP